MILPTTKELLSAAWDTCIADKRQAVTTSLYGVAVFSCLTLMRWHCTQDRTPAPTLTTDKGEAIRLTPNAMKAHTILYNAEMEKRAREALK